MIIVKHFDYEDFILHIFMFRHFTIIIGLSVFYVVSMSIRICTQLKSYLICTRLFYFLLILTVAIYNYHFKIVKYHHLYVIMHCCCFTLVSISAISYQYRFSYVHNRSCPYLMSISLMSTISYRFAFMHYVISCIGHLYKTYLNFLSISTISI